MKKYLNKKATVGFSVFCAIILFAFSGSHPTSGTGGYTGAPNDSVCTQCHTPGGSLTGTIEITGLPATVTPNTTYPLTVTITDTSPGGVAVRTGFQMVSLKENLANAGTFIVPASESNAQVKTVSGKSYVGHQPAKNFAADDTAIFDVEWTAPSSADGDITIYAATMITNGANGNSNDKFEATSLTTTLEGTADPITATFSNISDVTCSDSNDGSATVNATGGSGGFTYLWDNNESTSTAVNLTAGIHSVMITDNSDDSITETVEIGSPQPLTASIISSSDAECNNTTTGSAEIIATGGTPGYNYNWGNGISGAIQNNLLPATYIVTITDANSCTTNQEVFIGEPTPITTNIITMTEPSCNGDADGIFVVEASGGNGGFTYNWLTGGVGNPVEGSITDLPAGTYTIEVSDAIGCNTSTQLTLGEPNVVTVALDNTAVNCFEGSDGTVTALGSGGTGAFTYLWSNGATTAIATDLVAGTYTVTATDANECEIIDSITVIQPMTAVSIEININQSPNCGNTDGTIEAIISGGTSEYTYSWSTDTSTVVIGTSAILNEVPSGIYNVTVTDMNGCSATSQTELSEADEVSLAANNVINASCFGGNDGSATISASSTSDIFTYEWSNGGTNATEEGLIAGIYTIVVNDGNGCSGEITIEITEPSQLIAQAEITDIICNGANDGTITIAPEGGTGDITVLWNIGSDSLTIDNLVPGLYSVVLTDENNCEREIEYVINEPEAISTDNDIITPPSCTGTMDGSIEIFAMGGTGILSFNWSNGATDSIITNLSSGDYNLTITDQNNCEFVLAYTLDDPAPIETSATITPPSCAEGIDGSIILSIEGDNDSLGYTSIWSTGDTTLELLDITAGSYIVMITDSIGCSILDTFQLDDPTAINPNITVINESENGAADGSASSNPEDGEAPYQYLWSNGETTSMIDSLSPGSYSVTVTDSNGCFTSETVVVTSGDCLIMAMTIINNALCADSTSGSISIDLIGAVDPLIYEWSNNENGPILEDVGAGTYSVTIIDANQCQIQITDIMIEEPEPLDAVLNEITPASSTDGMDGAIDISFFGGSSGNFTATIIDVNNEPVEDAELNSLNPGTYNVLAEDENGCTRIFGPYTVELALSASEIQIEANIYPNPANQSFTIETKNPLDTAPVLFSLTGQKINIQASLAGNRYMMNTSNVSTGIYYIKMISNSKVELRKVLINK